MNVLYFGLPLGALLLDADGVTIAHAVMGRREGVGLRRLRRRLGDRVSVIRADASPAQIAAHVARLGLPPIDLLVSWFFPKKLPPSVLALPRLGGLGVHPSLLPRHRGPDPYFAAIDVGDTVTGVSAHRLEVEYDTGALLDAEPLTIDPSWDAWTLARKLDRPSLRVLRRVVRRFVQGEEIVERAQDEALATLAPAPEDAQLEVDVSMTVERALRRIRAAAPWPGVSLWIDAECIEIERARAVVNGAGLAPGELGVARGAVWLGVADGALQLERIRVEDDAAEASDGTRTLEGDALVAWVATRAKLLPMEGA